MKKIALTTAAILMLSTALPVFALEETNRDKVICELAAKNCLTQSEAFQKRLKKIQKDMAKGKTYSAEDIKNPLKLSPAAVDKLCLACHVNQPTQVGRLTGGHGRIGRKLRDIIGEKGQHALQVLGPRPRSPQVVLRFESLDPPSGSPPGCFWPDRSTAPAATKKRRARESWRASMLR